VSAEPATATDAADVYRPLLQTLSIGVATADPRTWKVDFENARFFEWFPPDPALDESLPTRVRGFDPDKAASRAERGRPYKLEVEVGSGARAKTIEVEVRTTTVGDRAVALVECHDASKRKEIEYMLDSYSRMVEKHTRELQRQKERSEKLLLNIMPRAVYEEMKDFGSVTPQRFEAATILLLDFVGFTDMAIASDPGAVVAELNDIFSAFDRIVELFECDRLKTIGDAYMAVSGIPEATGDHAANVARVALRMRRYLDRRNASRPESWLCRVGIDSGPVVGSIVGVQKYVYDIFGPGVNLAARLEALSDPMQITMSEKTYALVRDEFVCSEIGEVEVKGFGTQRLYSLDGEHARPR
jgi:class 3 adenylate cyclase